MSHDADMIMTVVCTLALFTHNPRSMPHPAETSLLPKNRKQWGMLTHSNQKQWKRRKKEKTLDDKYNFRALVALPKIL